MRIKIYDDLGKAHEAYMCGSGRTSKKRFYEKLAAETGIAIPVESDVLAKKKTHKKTSSPVRSVSQSELELHNKTIAKYRASANQNEAREWLAGGKPGSIRSLGEWDAETSQDIIENGYRAGAIKILAVDIGRSDHGDESTNHLIVELPTQPSKRSRMFKWSNELANQSGFGDDPDWGQSEDR